MRNSEIQRIAKHSDFKKSLNQGHFCSLACELDFDLLIFSNDRLPFRDQIAVNKNPPDSDIVCINHRLVAKVKKKIDVFILLFIARTFV